MFFYYIKALWLEFISIVPQSIKCLCFISYILYSAQTPVNMCVGSEIGGGCSFFLSQWEKCTLIGIPDAVTTETHSLSFPTHTHTLAIVSQTEGGQWGRKLGGADVKVISKSRTVLLLFQLNFGWLAFILAVYRWAGQAGDELGTCRWTCSRIWKADWSERSAQ